jgi:cytochrome c biogenesis protein CcmG/thiol:disulfide interchange protein DsbE
MSSTRTSSDRRVASARRIGDPRLSTRTRLVLAGLAVAVVAALAVAVVAGGDDASSGTDAAGVGSSVTVDGRDLPALPDSGRDPAVGATMPTLTGTDIHGDPITIAPDGRPTMVMFLAHWCPHCQREVPVVQDWVDDGGLPDGVRLVSVATANDDRRPNYPAVDWLDREGWTAPTLLDDADIHAGIAGGVSAFPFWVLVDGDGTVVARTSGELTPAQLTDLATQAAETTETVETAR